MLGENLAQSVGGGARVRCTLEGPREDPGGNEESDPFSLEAFRTTASISILEADDERVVFTLKGVDAPLANALRRILLSEVPTVAIETVQIWQNTGVVQDEVLAHRLGLIPFRVDPGMLLFREENTEISEDNALKLKLHVKCTEADLKPFDKALSVYARDLQWLPFSDRQKEKFASCPPVPVHPDILITKLRPGQEIELVAYLEKGLGKTHAKWSPVSTAVYRLEPEFVFSKPIVGAEAFELKELCPMGVFDVEDSGGVAYAKFPRNCTTCRACLERFDGRIQLNKLSDFFIFSIESSGSIPATKLLKMALEVLRDKAVTFREIIRTKQLQTAEELDAALVDKAIRLSISSSLPSQFCPNGAIKEFHSH